MSPRRQGPFFEINCAGLPQHLVESELFGHERGAFTGATTQKAGLVETAEGGTLFLDEVGELSPGAQAQLLTFLDRREFRRVGGTRTLSADVRILAATNVDLKAAADAGRFRRDLYFRLSVLPLELPPLRARRGEIPTLARNILGELARRGGRVPPEPTTRFVEALTSYDWPGNIRELRNTLERALILHRGQVIDIEQLPHEIRRPTPKISSPPEGNAIVLLRDLETEQIERALEAAGHNRTRAAQSLGISLSTLKRRLARKRAGQTG
jgi:transcriptional regulator with PAS, ATPase and Fis domain